MCGAAKQPFPARETFRKEIVMFCVISAGPATGNISATVYIVIGIIAAVVIIITAAAGIIGKKNKK